MFFYYLSYPYILESLKDTHHYIGYTTDLKRRVAEHAHSTSFSTKFRLLVRRIYYEACLEEQDAKQRERYFKSTAGRRFLAKRLRHFKANPVWHLE